MTTQERDLPASLDALRVAAGADAERYEASIAGGGEAVRRAAVRLENASIAGGDGEALRLTGKALAYHGDVEHIEDCPRVVYMEFIPSAAGLPKDWRGWARLDLTVRNGAVAMGVELTVLGSRSRLLSRRDFGAGETGTVSVDLRDLGLTSGIMPPYEPQTIRVSLFVPEGGPDGTCQLLRLTLAGTCPPGPLLDRWGQRINADWAGKVSSDADLGADLREEQGDFPNLPPPARGRFGGSLEGPRFSASGFFRVERDAGGRWWYADPEGLPFWSVGPTCVRLGDATNTAGREQLFAELPASGPDWTRDGAGRPLFYGLNVLRKYGSVEAWAAHTRERLVRWGCNTVANWSDLRVSGSRVAYVKSLSSRVLKPGGKFGNMPDVSDPAWEPALRELFFAEARPLAGDPWLIGYFVDNEMPWGVLREDTREEYAEKYFSTVRRVLKEADPNHLYMGCRFVRVMPDPVFARVAGRHVDVLSVNAYSIVPRRSEFDAWYSEAQRPIQIGEHQFALRDPRGLVTPWMALTAGEREKAVVEYSRSAASLPYCLGTHWFQFGDQPGAGRPSNGENMLIGIVDITDQPYPHMVSAFRNIGSQCYAWHAGSVTATRRTS